MSQHHDEATSRIFALDNTQRQSPLPGKMEEGKKKVRDGGALSEARLEIPFLQGIWESIVAKDQQCLTHFERSEAKQDLMGKNVLAASAPRTLTEVALNALNKVIDRRLQQQSPEGILQVAAAKSPMYNDRDFRVMFARAERMNPTKAADRLTAYLSYANYLFGQEALIQPVQTTAFTPIDEQVLRAGWIQLLLTRDHIGRRILVMEDLGPGDFSPPNKMRVAFFLLQAAAKDDDSQKMGIQVVLQIFDPVNSSLLNRPSIREQFRRLFACSPVRFSAIHICVGEGMSSGTGADEIEVAASTSSRNRDEEIITCVESLLGVDERIRTTFHSGSIIECHSRLSFFGINPDTIPMTSTGRVKLKDHEKWIMIQVGRDRAYQQGRTFPIVECPTNKHILLVKGRHVARHEGNMRLRSLLQERYDERNIATRAQKISITSEVLETLQDEGYTFLVKNNVDFWVIPDRKTVLEKLAIAFRTVPRLKPLSIAKTS
ncbi:hypothetical protein IV203_028646 [Nitzschia inconspicua]|uniref:DUF6824 domain-containing protein n=1 Tax=Nitzschia inconspicua TaxID=303405 RepID=A0A9K3LS66_9STRA|nr:hypothetical protein IV203_028646 [Nitzschia inconspicua]